MIKLIYQWIKLNNRLVGLWNNCSSWKFIFELGTGSWRSVIFLCNFWRRALRILSVETLLLELNPENIWSGQTLIHEAGSWSAQGIKSFAEWRIMLLRWPHMEQLPSQSHDDNVCDPYRQRRRTSVNQTTFTVGYRLFCYQLFWH